MTELCVIFVNAESLVSSFEIFLSKNDLSITVLDGVVAFGTSIVFVFDELP